MAERFGTEHSELVVRPDAVELLPRLVRHYGEPFADHSAIPSFYLAEMARREVTVALTGDGGDEVFGGYGRYAPTRRCCTASTPCRRHCGAGSRARSAACGRTASCAACATACARRRRGCHSIRASVRARGVALRTGSRRVALHA